MAELSTQSSAERSWDLAQAYALLFGYASVKLTAEQLSEIARELSEDPTIGHPEVRTLALSKLSDAISRGQHRERPNGPPPRPAPKPQPDGGRFHA